MNPLYTLGIQATLSITAFSFAALWHAVPRLKKIPLERALIPLLWVNGFRYAPLVLFAPGQVSGDLPESVRAGIAYGDLISALLAMCALYCLVHEMRGSLAAVWVFLVAGIVDSLYGLYAAMQARAYLYPLGTSWFIVAFYVPLIVVSEVVIGYLLVTQ